MLMRQSVLTIVIGAAAIATSCGGGAQTASVSSRTPAADPAAALARARGPVRPTACSLLSQQEMSAILGGAVAAPQGKEGPDTTSCRFSPANENAISPYAHVDIDWDAGEEAMAGSRIAAKVMGKDAGMAVAAPIEGLGDEASSMIGGVTNVRSGRTYIQITLGMQSHAKEKGIAIAKAILARLDDSAARR
jgi:hypothetical protein